MLLFGPMLTLRQVRAAAHFRVDLIAESLQIAGLLSSCPPLPTVTLQRFQDTVSSVTTYTVALFRVDSAGAANVLTYTLDPAEVPLGDSTTLSFPNQSLVCGADHYWTLTVGNVAECSPTVVTSPLFVPVSSIS